VVLSGRLHHSEHFVSVYRFLQKAKWDPDQVAFQVFRIIVDTLLHGATEFELVLDDTLNNHVGKKIFGAGVQHDGDAPKTGKPIGYGVCFVIIGIVVRLPEQGRFWNGKSFVQTWKRIKRRLFLCRAFEGRCGRYERLG
jgi:hypothetical protein